MTTLKTRPSILSVVAAGVLFALPSVSAAQAQKRGIPETAAPQRAAEAQDVKLAALPTEGKIADLEDLVGSTAIDFTLTDTDGNEHTLSDYVSDGKIVVLEWFCPTCPIVKRHYGETATMNDLVGKYAEEDVVWLAINSGADRSGGAELNGKAREDWDMAHPVLLDPAGEVGKAYGSKNTPTMYVIGADGTIAFGGGIDNNVRSASKTSTNYVEAAVDSLLVGSNVETSFAKPYGCSVKYKRK